MGEAQGDAACIGHLADEGAAADGFTVELDVDEVRLGMVGGERDQATATPNDLDMIWNFSLVY